MALPELDVARVQRWCAGTPARPLATSLTPASLRGPQCPIARDHARSSRRRGFRARSAASATAAFLRPGIPRGGVPGGALPGGAEDRLGDEDPEIL